MPTVPRYDAPQVNEQALPSVRVSANAPLEAFGGGQSAANVFHAAEGLAKTAEGIFLEEKKKADDLATQDAYAKTVQLKNRLIYDPKGGAITMRGKDALGISENYGSMFDQEADIIEQGLSNEDQRTMYRKMRQQQKLDLAGDLERHTAKEYLSYQEQVLKNGIATAQDDAILRYSTPVTDERGVAVPLGKDNQGWNQALVKQKLEEQRAFILSHADRNGMSGEAVKAQMSKAYSDTHSKVIMDMLDNHQDLMATRYFEANKGDITDGETLSKLTKALKEGSILGDAQRATDKIFEKTQDLEQADAIARQIEDPKLREKVQAMVEHRSNLLKNIADSQRSEQFQKAYKFVIDGGNVDSMPLSQRQLLTPNQEQMLRSVEKNKKTGELEKTSYKTWYDLRMKLADPINGLNYARNLDLNKYADLLTPQHYKALGEQQADVLNKKEHDNDALFSRGQIVESSLQSLHITDEPSQSYVKLEVESRYNAEAKRSGKRPDNEWVQKVTDEVARKALRDNMAKQTFPKPPKEKEYKFDTDVNHRIITEQVKSIVPKDKNGKIAADITAAARRSWETAKESGVVMSNDQVAGTAQMYAKKYLLEKRSALGMDFLAKDKEKFGYEITMDDVPEDFKKQAVAWMQGKKLPVTDRAVVHYYVKSLSKGGN